MRLIFKYRRDRLRTELVSLLQSHLRWMNNQPMLLRIRIANNTFYQNNVRYILQSDPDISSPFESEKAESNTTCVSWAGLHKNDSITGREIFSFPEGDTDSYSSSILIVNNRNIDSPHPKFNGCEYLDIQVINENDDSYAALSILLQDRNGYSIIIE